MHLKNFEFADHVIGFIAADKINLELAQEVHHKIDAALLEYDQISIYFEDASEGQVDVSALLEDIFFKLKRADRFHRIALVSDSTLIYIYAKIKSAFMNADIKLFKADERTLALSWVSTF